MGQVFLNSRHPLVAITSKEKAISLGNLLGSNMFNILAVLGITSMITPITANDQGLIDFDLIWMLVLSLGIFPLVFAPGRMRLSWGEGLILLGSYVVFISIVFNKKCLLKKKAFLI